MLPVHAPGEQEQTAPPAVTPCAWCQLLPSPLPAGPRRQWCQPWGCQEACCYDNGPGWVGVMGMSDQSSSGAWARLGQGLRGGGARTLGTRPATYLPRCGSQGDSGTGTPQRLELRCRAAGERSSRQAPHLPRARRPAPQPAALTALWPPPRTRPRSSAPSFWRPRRPWPRPRIPRASERAPRPPPPPGEPRHTRGRAQASGCGRGRGHTLAPHGRAGRSARPAAPVSLVARGRWLRRGVTEGAGIDCP